MIADVARLLLGFAATARCCDRVAQSRRSVSELAVPVVAIAPSVPASGADSVAATGSIVVESGSSALTAVERPRSDGDIGSDSHSSTAATVAPQAPSSADPPPLDTGSSSLQSPQLTCTLAPACQDASTAQADVPGEVLVACFVATMTLATTTTPAAPRYHSNAVFIKNFWTPDHVRAVGVTAPCRVCKARYDCGACFSPATIEACHTVAWLTLECGHTDLVCVFGAVGVIFIVCSYRRSSTAAIATSPPQ